MAVAFGPDNVLYALELSHVSGFPAPGNGKVVRIKSSGEIDDVITGLNEPDGITGVRMDGSTFLTTAQSPLPTTA